MHDFQEYFSTNFQEQSDFSGLPSPCSGIFEKKIQDFPGNAGTLWLTNQLGNFQLTKWSIFDRFLTGMGFLKTSLDSSRTTNHGIGQKKGLALASKTIGHSLALFVKNNVV